MYRVKYAVLMVVLLLASMVSAQEKVQPTDSKLFIQFPLGGSGEESVTSDSVANIPEIKQMVTSANGHVDTVIVARVSANHDIWKFARHWGKTDVAVQRLTRMGDGAVRVSRLTWLIEGLEKAGLQNIHYNLCWVPDYDSVPSIKVSLGFVPYDNGTSARLDSLESELDSLTAYGTGNDTGKVVNNYFSTIYQGVSFASGIGVTADSYCFSVSPRAELKANGIGAVEVYGFYEPFNHEQQIIAEIQSDSYFFGWGVNVALNAMLIPGWIGLVDSTTVVNWPIDGMVGYQQVDHYFNYGGGHDFRFTGKSIGLRWHVVKTFNTDSRWDLRVDIQQFYGSEKYFNLFAAKTGLTNTSISASLVYEF